MKRDPAQPEHIWIIGASAGIGEALAHELATLGHKLAISARDAGALKLLKDSLHGHDHLTAALDVNDPDDIAGARDKILESWPHIDRLVFLAGIYEPMHFGNMDLAETRRILDTNLLGAFHLVEMVLPVLKKRGQGQIAICASVAGYRGLPGGQPYGASKAGLINLAESLKTEHGNWLDVKLINPGFVKSRLTDKNDFQMPMRISAQDAAKAISKGLYSGGFEIHFPFAFTLAMKALRALPYWLFFRIVKRHD